MLRRSISVLFLLSLLGLVMILAYAAWNKAAAPDALDRAAALLEDGKPRDALVLLNHTDRSLGPSGHRDLRRRLHDLRYRARVEIARYQRALEDVEILLRHYPDLDAEHRLELQRAKIELLLESANDDKQRLSLALNEARRLLADIGDDARVLELAGRITQTTYQLELTELLNGEFPLHFAGSFLTVARRRLLTFLYRNSDDPTGIRERKRFEQELRQRTSDAITLEELKDKIDSIQRRIHESVGYYRRALRDEDDTFPALQGYTGMLLRGGRLDEAAILSWLYLQRFPEEYGSVIAASRGMEAWLRLDDAEQAAACGRRWLGATGVRGFAELFDIDEHWVRAYVLFARALHAVGATEELEQLTDELGKLEADTPALWTWGNFLRGLTADLIQGRDWLERELDRFCRFTDQEPPAEGADLFRMALEMRAAWADRSKDSELLKKVLDAWIEARPDEARPRLRRARLLLEQGQPWLAARDANKVIGVEGVSATVRDEALLLVLQAREQQHARDGQDSASLLEAIVATQSTAPLSIRDPVLHIGIARLALEKELYEIAEVNLREAASHYPWSLTLRRLQAACHFAVGEDALYDAAFVLERDPDDVDTRLRQIAALQRAQASTYRLRAAERELITRHPRLPRSAMRFAEHLLERGAYDAALQVAEESRAADQAKDVLAWVRGRALLGLGKIGEGVAALQQVPPGSEYRLPALATALEAAATEPRADLATLRKKFVAAEPDGKTLRRVAETLVTNGYLRTAYELLLKLDQDQDMIEQRDGRLYVLLGRVRYALGQVAGAQQDWDAAFPKEDGNEAIPLLALSYVLDGKKGEATEVLRYAPKPVGHPLTLAYLYFVLDDTDQARAHLRRFESPSPILQTILMMAFELSVDPEKEPATKTPYPFINKLVERKPAALFEAITLAAGVAFEARSIEALRAVELALDEDEVLEAPAFRMLSALRDLVAGRKRRTYTRLMNLVHDQPLFFPAYDDLMRVGEELNPDSLIDPNMMSRYFGLARLLDPALLPQSSFTRIWFSGAANLSLEKGDLHAAEQYLMVAHLAAPSDAGPLRMLVRAARQRGDYVAALKKQLSVLRTGEPSRRHRDLRLACELALEVLDTPKAAATRDEVRDLVAPIEKEARDWQDAEPSATHPPLGSAALLIARLLPPADDEIALAQRKIEVLQRSLEPYVAGELPARLDPQGIRSVLAEIDRLGGHETVAQAMDRLLTFDPSWVDLWLFKATVQEAAGDAPAATGAIAWIPELLPADARVLAELGRLCGTYATRGRASWSDLLRALDAHESHARLTVAKGLLHLRTGKPESTVGLLSSVADDLRPHEGWLRDVAEILAEREGKRPDVAARMRARDDDAWSSAEIAAQLRHLIEAAAEEKKLEEDEEDRRDASTSNGDTRRERRVPAEAGK